MFCPISYSVVDIIIASRSKLNKMAFLVYSD
jgi:hypothetical protein